MNKENTREKKIEQMFALNPEMDEVFVTSNDLGFTDEVKANSHAHGLKDKKVKKYTRKDVLKKPPAKSKILDQGVKKLTAALEEVTDVAILEALKAEEASFGDEARKTAIAAIEDRIKAITDAIDVVVEGAGNDGNTEDNSDTGATTDTEGNSGTDN